MLPLVAAVIILFIVFSFTGLFKSNPTTIDQHVNLEKNPEEIRQPIYLPFKDGPFHMTMGLQSLDFHRWIELDFLYRHEIKLKRQLLQSQRRSDLFLCDEKAFEPSVELLQLLIQHLPDQFPSMFERNRTNTMIINHITKETFNTTIDTDRIHPLEIASLLVQEDFAVLQFDPNTQNYHANGLAVCFPSGWLPRDKFRLPLTSIHSPSVPFYKEKLSASVDRYFVKLQVEKPVQRLNWSLQVGDELCRTGSNETTTNLITPQNVGQLVYLRVERQTLRRLPKSKAIIFTIKTYLNKIEEVCRNDPQIAGRLSSAVENWPPELLSYKEAHRYKDSLLAYLKNIA